MRLDSARELKRSITEQILGPMASGAIASVRSFALSASPMEHLEAAIPSVAVGLTQTKGQGPEPEEFEIAIRCQREELMDGPEVDRIRTKAHGEVNVRFVGRLRKRSATPWNRKSVRPLKIGLSCGHFRITAGTLGCFVRPRGQPDGRFILSNNHVLADENKAKVGDAIVQPGSLDGGKRPSDVVAGLAKTVKLAKTGANFVDAAIAALKPSVAADLTTIKGLGRLAGLGGSFVDAGTEVAKLGRTTGLTRGRVTAFELDNVVVQYDLGNLRFDDQIEIEGSGADAFSAGGDSGSLIVTADARVAVALLFAGGDVGGTNGKGLTYANPIHRVLDDLQIDLAL